MGELRAPTALFKERHPQLRFQLGDGVAETGLGDAELLCGTGIVLRSGQFHKVTKMQKIHDGHLSLFHKYSHEQNFKSIVVTMDSGHGRNRESLIYCRKRSPFLV